MLDYVYLLACHERFKIGYSCSPHVRRTAVRFDTKLNLHLVAMLKGGRSLERKIHKRFDAFRIEGEWFEPRPEIAEWFNQQRGIIDPGRPYYPNNTPRKKLASEELGRPVAHWELKYWCGDKRTQDEEAKS